MVEKNQEPEYFADLKTYQYAHLAEMLSQSEETKQYVPGAFEQLASERKKYMPDTEYALFLDCMKHERGLEGLLGIYPGKYNKVHDNLTVGEFLTYYDKIITGYLDEEKSGKLKGLLGKFGTSKLTGIGKKLDEVAYKLLGHEKGYQKLSDDELKKSQKTMKEYKGINDLIKFIESIYFEELKPTVIKKANKQILSQMIDALPNPEK